MPVSVHIVLPCYNPGIKWPGELASFWRAAKETYDLHFTLVNDGTAGNKVKEQLQLPELNNIPITYLHYPDNKGKGYALRHGVAQANNGVVVYTDVDFPFTNQSMLALIDQLAKGECDVAAGFRSGAYYQKKMSGFRKWLSKAFRFFISKILRMAITDTQCGLKGFNQKGKEKFLATSTNRYLFDFEFVYSCCRDKNIVIAPISVELKEGVVFSSMRPKILLQELFNLISILLGRKRRG